MKKILIFLLTVTCISCATGAKMRKLNEGMPLTTVINILGDPDAFKRSGGYMLLTYTNRASSIWDTNGESDYIVVLKGDKVIEYGREEHGHSYADIFIAKTKRKKEKGQDQLLAQNRGKADKPERIIKKAVKSPEPQIRVKRKAEAVEGKKTPLEPKINILKKKKDDILVVAEAKLREPPPNGREEFKKAAIVKKKSPGEAALLKAKKENVAALTTLPSIIKREKKRRHHILNSEKEKEKIKKYLQSWKLAWEGRDIDRYISFYSKTFTTSKHNRESYRAYKESLFKKTDFISVEMSGIDIRWEKFMIVASFTQEYRSQTFRSTRKKIIYFQQEENDWKIIKEIVFL